MKQARLYFNIFVSIVSICQGDMVTLKKLEEQGPGKNVYACVGQTGEVVKTHFLVCSF